MLSAINFEVVSFAEDEKLFELASLVQNHCKS